MRNLFQFLLGFLLILFQVGGAIIVFFVSELASDFIVSFLCVRELPSRSDRLNILLGITLSPRCGLRGHIHFVDEGGEGHEHPGEKERGGGERKKPPPKTAIFFPNIRAALSPYFLCFIN